MENKSTVWFTDFHCRPGISILEKLNRLLTAAGFDSIDFTDKYVAVKVHFGEWGNMSFLRQQYAKIVCDRVKEAGGKPFLTDCNTLYAGYRHNALDHLDAAYMNGYNPLSTGVHTVIADGLRGTDERLIPVEGGEYIKTAKIGSAIAEADVLISLTHFKGHCNAGFGGVLKNIGMGCGSKHGKMEMHSAGTPAINRNKCIGCGSCVKNCMHGGVKIIDGKAVIQESSCVGCGHCFAFCPKGAVECKWDEAMPVLNRKIAEYTKAAINGKPAFHISFVEDVSPDCDCDCSNDIPVVPDIGIFAGFDPVAVDRACVDAVNAAPPVPGSALTKVLEKKPLQANKKQDVFRMLHTGTDWLAGQLHAEKIGLGTSAYELKKI